MGEHRPFSGGEFRVLEAGEEGGLHRPVGAGTRHQRLQVAGALVRRP
jgi:hypothetical protein